MHVLITGASRGLGLGLARHYLAAGWKVSAVNRPGHEDDIYFMSEGCWHPYYYDVRDQAGIAKLIQGMAERKDLPDLWLLTAGINKPDVWQGVLDDEAYREVWNTNFEGVVHFLQAAARVGMTNTMQIVCASSTSIIFGNPRCRAYNDSKRALHEAFASSDTGRGGLRFRSLILGPLATDMGRGDPNASWLQRRIRQWLMVEVEDAVPVIARFLEGHAQALWWPRKAVWTMYLLKWACRVWPGLYRG